MSIFYWPLKPKYSKYKVKYKTLKFRVDSLKIKVSCPENKLPRVINHTG